MTINFLNQQIFRITLFFNPTLDANHDLHGLQIPLSIINGLIWNLILRMDLDLLCFRLLQFV